MIKTLKDLIELNGGILISVDGKNIVTRVYQSVFFTKFMEKDFVKIDTKEIPCSPGEVSFSVASDIIEFNQETIKISSLDPEVIKRIFIWVLEQATPYLAKIAKELNTEIIISNSLDEHSGDFESYASLGDDVPVLLLSINKKT
jgi:hypothetical protein